MDPASREGSRGRGLRLPTYGPTPWGTPVDWSLYALSPLSQEWGLPMGQLRFWRNLAAAVPTPGGLSQTDSLPSQTSGQIQQACMMQWPGERASIPTTKQIKRKTRGQLRVATALPLRTYIC